jgi:hypothetical protein
MSEPNDYDKLKALVKKHKMYGHLDPGGAELTHPEFGTCRISSCDDAFDLKLVEDFLRKHGVEP